MFAGAGVKVTIAFRSRLLPEAEPEIGTALTRYFERESIIVRGGLSYRDIRRAQSGIALSVIADGRSEVISADQGLVTTGRRPNTAGMGLKEAGGGLLPNGGREGHDRFGPSKRGGVTLWRG